MKINWRVTKKRKYTSIIKLQRNKREVKKRTRQKGYKGYNCRSIKDTHKNLRFIARSLQWKALELVDEFQDQKEISNEGQPIVMEEG